MSLSLWTRPPPTPCPLVRSLAGHATITYVAMLPGGSRFRRFPCLVCLLLAGWAYGQAAQPATPPAEGGKAEQSPAATDKAPEMKVGPDDPVITLRSEERRVGKEC